MKLVAIQTRMCQQAESSELHPLQELEAPEQLPTRKFLLPFACACVRGWGCGCVPVR